MVKEVKYQNKKKECEHDALLLLVFTLNVLLQKISILPHHPLATWKVYQFTGLNLSLKFLSVFFHLQDPPLHDLLNDRSWCGD